MTRPVPAQAAADTPGPDEQDPVRPAPAHGVASPAGAVREAGRGLAGRGGLGVLYRLGVSATVLHPERAVLPDRSEST